MGLGFGMLGRILRGWWGVLGRGAGEREGVFWGNARELWEGRIWEGM